jgi:DNA-directed RNA polymerase subunit E'/Rpb7
MQSTAFFETKVALSPKDLNSLETRTVESILLEKVQAKIEDKCTSNGFVIPGTVKILSRSVGYFEAARFTADTIYYVKSEAQVLYPVDGVRVEGEVIRKNKMGMYVTHRNAIRIQIPRDLHLGNEDYEATEIGDKVEVELKRSKFQVNDPFILATGVFIRRVDGATAVSMPEESKLEEEAVEEQPPAAGEGKEVEEQPPAVGEGKEIVDNGGVVESKGTMRL